MSLRCTGGSMQDGFHSISQEIFVSSPNSVHRSTRARRRLSSSRVTLTSFLRSQVSFRRQHMKDGLCSISKFGALKHQGKTKTMFELGDLDLIFKVTGHSSHSACDGWFRSLSEEIFDVSSTNLVHRSSRTR